MPNVKNIVMKRALVLNNWVHRFSQFYFFSSFKNFSDDCIRFFKCQNLAYQSRFLWCSDIRINKYSKIKFRCELVIWSRFHLRSLFWSAGFDNIKKSIKCFENYFKVYFWKWFSTAVYKLKIVLEFFNFHLKLIFNIISV